MIHGEFWSAVYFEIGFHLIQLMG